MYGSHRWVNLLFTKHKNYRFLHLNTTESQLPVITIPVYIQSKLKKLQIKQEIERLEDIRSRTRQGNKKVLLISCKRRNYNHYLGQSYKKFEPVRLVSQGWMRRKYYGDYFIINPYGKNPASDPQCLHAKSFVELNLDPDIIQGISALGFKQPTSVQEQAIPAILKQKNTLFCAETGSGKTLAYLAPLIHLLKQKKELFTQERPPNSPRALVLVPSQELAIQIGKIAKIVSSSCDVNVSLLVGGQDYEALKEMKKEHPKLDLIVSTLGIMKRFVRQGIYNLNYIQHVVLDEADTMVDDSFSGTLRQLLTNILFQEQSAETQTRHDHGAQLILSGATMPQNLEEAFEQIVNVNSLKTIKTSHLHRIMPHITQKFLRVKKDLKIGILLEMVKKDVENNKGTIVFCNSSPGCIFVSKYLAENGVQCFSLHSNMSRKSRLGQFESFQKGERKVLCCTDLGSRGLDTILANHVINFEFPNHMSDYIHRVGRTGRVGMKGGLVTNLISRKFSVVLVQKIEAAARRIGNLPDVNANIQRNINEYILAKEARKNEHSTEKVVEQIQ